MIIPLLHRWYNIRLVYAEMHLLYVLCPIKVLQIFFQVTLDLIKHLSILVIYGWLIFHLHLKCIVRMETMNHEDPNVQEALYSHLTINLR